jgi:hypothetical protein
MGHIVFREAQFSVRRREIGGGDRTRLTHCNVHANPVVQLITPKIPTKYPTDQIKAIQARSPPQKNPHWTGQLGISGRSSGSPTAATICAGNAIVLMQAVHIQFHTRR